MKSVLLRFAVLTFAFTAFSAAQDAEGCKDSPLVSRMPGSRLIGCEHKEFEQLQVITGLDKQENDITRTLEGDYSLLDYEARPETSSIQVFRNFQNAFRQAGFSEVHARQPNYLLVKKGALYAVLDSSAGEAYNLKLLTEKAMEQEVKVDAPYLLSELDKAGRVSIYGINFDTGKATVLPTSEAVLTEVYRLLEGSPDLKLRVEGHTDNTGPKAANEHLSLQRAQAVVTWLTSKGIAAQRLTPLGFGDTKPVADNDSEAGRAKNRRVDLVKQ